MILAGEPTIFIRYNVKNNDNQVTRIPKIIRDIHSYLLFVGFTSFIAINDKDIDLVSNDLNTKLIVAKKDVNYLDIIHSITTDVNNTDIIIINVDINAKDKLCDINITYGNHSRIINKDINVMTATSGKIFNIDAIKVIIKSIFEYDDLLEQQSLLNFIDVYRSLVYSYQLVYGAPMIIPDHIPTDVDKLIQDLDLMSTKLHFYPINNYSRKDVINSRLQFVKKYLKLYRKVDILIGLISNLRNRSHKTPIWHLAKLIYNRVLDSTATKLKRKSNIVECYRNDILSKLNEC